MKAKALQRRNLLAVAVLDVILIAIVPVMALMGSLAA